MWARLSPVSTTRSGSSLARPRSHSCLARWSGAMWMSLRWSTFRGAWPAGSSGTSTRRSVYCRASHAAYAARPAPAAAPRVAVRARTGRRRMRQGCHNGAMSALKDRLRADLTTAIKARDELRSSTLRMVLTAITTAEVAGKQARELSDDDIVGVLSTEAKKRREASTAFADAGRTELADKERAEAAVIADYLPAQLDQAEIADLVT